MTQHMTVAEYLESEERIRPGKRRTKTQRKARDEHCEQVEVIDWCDFASGHKRALKWIFAVPNGGHRAKSVAGKMKAEGAKAGVPDLVLPIVTDAYPGMYLEMKAMDGSEAKNQREWRTFLTEQGYLSIVCKGATAAIREICEYVGLDADAELAKWEVVKDGRRKRMARAMAP